MRTTLGLIAQSISLLALAGCASIIGDTTQTIQVTTTCNSEMVPGATCSLQNDQGTYNVYTPGAVLVRKSDADISIGCRKNDQVTPTYRFSAAMSGDVWGNLIFGGPIGVVVDAASGAGFNYPLSITVWWPEDACAKLK